MKQKKYIAVLLATTITTGTCPILQGFADTEISNEATLERTCSKYYQSNAVVNSINGTTGDGTNNGYEQYNKNSSVDNKKWGGYAFSQFTLTDEQINAGIEEATFEAYISNTAATCKVKANETSLNDYDSLTYSNYLESYGYDGVSNYTATSENVTIDGTKYVKITADVSDCVKKAAEAMAYKALDGKKVYAFGDSIVYGHNAPEQSFMQLLSNNYGMNLTMLAKNGATVVTTDSESKEDPSEETTGNYILNQIEDAPSEKPDVVIFDGYTNDAYGDKETDSFNSDGAHINIWKHLGAIQGKDASEFDTSTFCGGFEKIIYEMRQKWGDTPIVFTTIHKSGGRDWETQCKLRELALEICNKWGVSVADIFNDTSLDTRDSEQMSKYIIGGNGSHPNVSGCNEFYIPIVAKTFNEILSANDNTNDTEQALANVTVAVTSCNSRAKMLPYGSEYQPKLTLKFNDDSETVPEKDGAVYSVTTKATSTNPTVDISKISNSVNITGYQVTVAKDKKQISQTVVERGDNVNGLDSINVTASEGDDIEIAPIYEYKKTLSYGNGITLEDVFPNGRYNITVTNGSTNHTDLYVNGYMAANNIDQNGAGRSVSTGSTYTANDIRVESDEKKITIQTKDSANNLSYVKIVKSPSVVTPKKKIFITGDSLVANYYGGNEGNYLGNTQTGWGQALSNFINNDEYEVVNLANAGYWAATLKTTAYPGIIYNAVDGDIFLLESGVNDYWNPDSNGATPGLDTNRSTMKTSVTEMVEGAGKVNIPIILVNPNAMPSRHDISNCFSDVMLEVAKEQEIPSIDLTALSSQILNELYYSEDEDTFKNNIGNNLGVIKGKASDYTHSSYLGAMKYASIVAEQLYKLGYKDMINTEYSYSKNDSLGNTIVCNVSTVTPTTSPTVTPTAKPTSTPTVVPTASPTVKPTATPTASPTVKPTSTPTVAPTASQTASPTTTPTENPIEKQCVKITAEYDEQGVLKNINTETINVSDIVKADNSGNKKTFYWESLESMKPITIEDTKYTLPNNINDTVDLVVFAGQSNMAGRGSTSDATVCDINAGFEYKSVSNPLTLVPITEPFGLNEDREGAIYDYNSDGTTKRTGSMVSAVVDEYYKQTDRQIVAVSASIGGTSTSEWKANYINDAVKRLDDAKAFLSANKVRIGRTFVVWCQGETDGDNKVSAQTYTANTKELFNRFKQHGAEKCFMVQIGHYRNGGAKDTQYGIIRDAQAALCKSDEDFVLAGSLEPYRKDMKDNFHYHQATYNAVGKTVGGNISDFYKSEINPLPSESPKPSNEPLIDDYQVFVFGGDSSSDEETVVDKDTAYGKQPNGKTYGFYGLKNSSDVSDGRTDGFKYSQGEPYTVLKSGKTDGKSYVEADYSTYDEDTLKNIAGGKMPVRFSVEADEHKYYTVSATVVNTSSTENANVTLYSEKRHAILSGYTLKPNESITKTWNVNLESVAYLSEDNPRSDTQLNFSVVGDNAGLSKIEIRKNDTFGTTVWMADDSTGFDQTSFIPYYPLRNYGGVGSLLTKYLNPDIALSNQGESGLGVTRDEKHWDNIKAHANKGDYIFVQYGYNDHSVDTHISGLEKYYDFAKENDIKLVIISQTDRRNTSVNWDSTNKKWTASMSGYASADKKFVDDKIAEGATGIAYVDLNTPYVEWMNTVGNTIFEQRKKAGFDDTGISNLAMNYYYMASRAEGIDTVHINDYGADRAAYIIAQQIKDTVEKGDTSNATDNEKIQADTLRPLTKNMTDYKPSEVSDETVAKGWAINDEYPNAFAGDIVYDYPTMIKAAELDNNVLKNITVKIQQESLPKYAIGCVDILNSDGTVKETLYTTSTSLNANMPYIDTSNTSYGQIVTMNFENAQIPTDGSYRAYIKGVDNGQKPSESDIMYSSYYTEPATVISSLMNENFDYAENSSVVNQGSPKWEFSGSASQKEYTTTIKDNEKCMKIAMDGNGTYSLCRQFFDYTKVNDGKIKLHFQINYSYGKFIVKLNKTTKTASFMNGLEALTVNDGEMFLPDGTSAGNIKTGKWTDIDVIFDIDCGTETVYIAGNDGVSCNIEKLQTENKTDAEQLLPVVGISFTYVQNPSTIVAYPFEAHITDLMIDKVETDTPQINVDISSENGTVSGGGSYNINSDITLTATPDDNYAFIGWYDGDNIYSADNPLNIERVRKDISLTAKFKEVDFDNDTTIEIKENAEYITQIRENDICVLETATEEQIINEIQSKYGLELSYSVNDNVLTVTSQNGNTQKTYRITVVKMWDLTKAVSEKTDVNTFEYNGLTIQGNGTSDYIDTNVGMHFKGKTASANRYISYTPESDGVLEITARRAYSKGELYVTTNSNCSGGTVVENLKDNIEWQSGVISVSKDKTYYLYNVTSGMEIQKITFTPSE